MREQVQALAETWIKGIVLDEACAREFAYAASILEAAAATTMANAMRPKHVITMSRLWRTEAGSRR
ncbi:hypothetical protein J2X36_005389 [Methylobacterium sp. BE186]|uniref:hypothetical protein n=1 Tax=Methylobacterium sp. BE186 TaxID=2817715 RepID=UPI002865D4B1|nr:hypothetical protein [Methylobacterium sp. BE186]MDR7040606.1 hypothetical protein [Methylobacterium sp. BE186]